MSNIYLINTTTNTIAGRFESVTDAEIAGELLLGTDGYYVGDREDLAKWKMAELFRLAQSVGETAKDWNFKAKTWGVERLVELADAYNFAPPAPAPEAKPEPKAKGERKARGPKLQDLMREALDRGETICAGDYPNNTHKTFIGQIRALRNAKYAGPLGPMVIVAVGDGTCFKKG